MAEVSGLLVKVRGDGRGFAARLKSLGVAESGVEPILSIPAERSSDPGVSAGQKAAWLRLHEAVSASGNPWDAAHAALEGEGAHGLAASADVLAVEPDVVQRWDYRGRDANRGLAASGRPVCVFNDQDPGGGRATVRGVAWHLGDDFSQLAAARARVGDKQKKITIAHLDTGYDPAHRTLPQGLDKERQRNFVEGGGPHKDATDRAPAGSPVANRGHGTGTLSLLAGNRLNGSSPNWPGFTDHVGGAPLANVIPVRIADWVVRFSTSTMVKGIDYARQCGAHVLSMSMGGITSAALADAVNLAYEGGLVMVTAAGNNFAKIPSPKTIVYPARYGRVIAACGLMGDGRAYTDLDFGTMQGNYGPAAKMATALGAFTPNVPWAEIGCPEIVDMDGAGTSAATPQIAAAVALWLAEHWEALKAYPQLWMRVEAVRFALFSKALKKTKKMGLAETLEKIGQGAIRVADALDVGPRARNRLQKLAPDSGAWNLLDLAVGEISGAFGVAPPERRRAAMFALELTQMAQRFAAVDAAAADLAEGDQGAAARRRYLEVALDEGDPSRQLRQFLERSLGRKALPATAVPRQAVVWRRRRRPSPVRRLRIFALDPSIGQRLDSVAVHAATVSLPWDDAPDTAEPLRPGPIGEYIEVIDVDPASNRVYAPVDLNEKALLAEDGLAPSEGNPQFHQQMVYAVAMMTIGNFERALGRRALWSPHFETTVSDDGNVDFTAREVRRLRLYPHALRTQNAYYSPDKKAILFGYFPAESAPGETTVAGTTVFSCLSADIISHEMSHALLDGLHRRFQEASNPDVPAFHEAFADIVAVFQHFTMQDLLRHEIARVRGDLSSANLLSGLARQFGEGSGRSGPLREYAQAKMAELDYDKSFEPHDRGSILVYAVYEAFLALVARRTEDLVHLATGGTGVLPAGSLHPGLVDRLAAETARTAQQVLTMCIRALDYCPAVDITFGEYLRALITADADAFPQDPLQSRIAFIESFKRWKLLPRDVRSMSEETLIWGTLEEPKPAWLSSIMADIDLSWDRKLSRSEVFELNEKNRKTMHEALRRVFAKDPTLYGQFGLIPDLPRYRQDGSLMKRPKKGDTTFDVFSVRPTRRVAPDGSFRVEMIVIVHQRQPVRLDGSVALDGIEAGPDGGPREEFFWFRGGATVIIDPRRGEEEIRYSIIKNSGSEGRRLRQAETARGSYVSPLRALYFGHDREPFAAMHAGGKDDGLV